MDRIMNSIPFIDISDTNCWMVYIMPFSDEEKADWALVNKVQSKCIENRFFGMGWDLKDAFEYGEEINETKVEYYKTLYRTKTGYDVSDRAVKGYSQIKAGDYVITRLRNSRYYVGRVSSRAKYIYRDDDINQYFSWGCFVDEWVEFATAESIPSEIVGRFSQRLHSTIQRINTYRLRLLIISMYETNSKEREPRIKVPKLRIGEYNFVRSMNYEELEDLMALFIYERHKSDGFILLPSSCKVSEPKYEYRFVSASGETITCQVKNQENIEPEDYENESAYKMIYVFSGLWSKEQIKTFRDKYNGRTNIYIPSREELFSTLKANKSFSNPYYDFENAPIDTRSVRLDGYNKCEKLNRNSSDYKNYVISPDFICFLRYDGLFFSSEFNSLILSYHILGDSEEAHKKEIEYANAILSDLNHSN